MAFARLKASWSKILFTLMIGRLYDKIYKDLIVKLIFTFFYHSSSNFVIVVGVHANLVSLINLIQQKINHVFLVGLIFGFKVLIVVYYM